MSHVTPAKPRGRQARQRAIARNTAELCYDTMVQNILDAYAVAIEHGARPWYADAAAEAKAYADRTGLPSRTMVGIIAALSPSTSWERNLQLAFTMAETGDCAHAYGDAIRKARAIRDGADPYDVLGGRKVRSFFRNISHPDRPGAVTVDRHALSIAMNSPQRARTRTMSNKDLKILDRPGVYAMVAACYRSAARSLGTAPHDLQSVTWDYWRDTHAYGVTANVEAF